MARRRVGVRRTRQPSILVGTVGARRAERTCVVRPRVAGVADAAQHAVGEVGEACRVAGTRFALIKSRICPHWPVGTGAAVCTACLALRSLELASSTGFTGPPCVVKPAREACVAHTGHQGVSVCVFVSGRGAGAQNCKSWHSEVGGQDRAQGGENTGRARPG